MRTWVRVRVKVRVKVTVRLRLRVRVKGWLRLSLSLSLSLGLSLTRWSRGTPRNSRAWYTAPGLGLPSPGATRRSPVPSTASRHATRRTCCRAARWAARAASRGRSASTEPPRRERQSPFVHCTVHLSCSCSCIVGTWRLALLVAGLYIPCLYCAYIPLSRRPRHQSIQTETFSLS